MEVFWSYCAFLVAFVCCDIMQLESLSKNHLHKIDAIKEIVESIASQHSHSSVNLIYDSFYHDFANLLIAEINPSAKVMIEMYKGVQEITHYKRSFSILMAESVEDILEILDGHFFHIHGYFLIMSRNKIDIEISRIFKEYWTEHIVNVAFMNEREKSIDLFTFFPHHQGQCDTHNSSKINEFNATAHRWTSNIFFPRKLSNLHRCIIKIGTFVTMPAVMKIDNPKSISNETKIIGSEVDIINGISEILNFTAEFHIFSSIESGMIYENKSSTGLLQKVMENEVDVIIGHLSLQYVRWKFLSASRSYTVVPTLIIIPPGDFISPFKKLFHPFSAIIWYSVIGVFAISFVVITITRRRSEKAYNFIVGQNVKYPTMNMVIACFGQSQKKLPIRNFSRFALTNLLLFCLVIR